MKWATDPKWNKQLKEERKNGKHHATTITTHIETKKNDDTKVDLWRLLVGRFRNFGFVRFVYYASNWMRTKQIYENDNDHGEKNGRTKRTFEWTFPHILRPIAVYEKEMQAVYAYNALVLFFYFVRQKCALHFRLNVFGFQSLFWLSKWVLWVDLHKFGCQNW